MWRRRWPLKIERTSYATLDTLTPETVDKFVPDVDLDEESFDELVVKAVSSLLHVAVVGGIDNYRDIVSRVIDVAKKEGVDLERAIGKDMLTRLRAFVKTGLRDSEDTEMSFAEHDKV